MFSDWILIAMCSGCAHAASVCLSSISLCKQASKPGDLFISLEFRSSDRVANGKEVYAYAAFVQINIYARQSCTTLKNEGRVP